MIATRTIYQQFAILKVCMMVVMMVMVMGLGTTRKECQSLVKHSGLTNSLRRASPAHDALPSCAGAASGASPATRQRG